METKSLISLIFLLQAIINSGNLVTSQKPKPTQQIAKCTSNENLSDALLEERDVALKLLFSNIGRYIGYQTGKSNVVYCTALCPPNIKKETCHECINNTIPYLKTSCPKQREAVAWTVLPKVSCMTAANAGELEKGLNNLADKLKGPAAGGDDIKKYASGNLTYGPGSCVLYGSMQCTPRMDEDTCMKCLSDATKECDSDYAPFKNIRDKYQLPEMIKEARESCGENGRNRNDDLTGKSLPIPFRLAFRKL
ncbi:hypothetical protein L1987_69736 [Smallanthus sonchifolius]|uniref:Uncharacterized protein n=1 Tax=Smallanthus sonchifolius TaxID=185202 RepID=A0ACB9B703_9ASTR|nr:hypothetical protein L1987_69736 [Smallanthus sonchifolius]